MELCFEEINAETMYLAVRKVNEYFSENQQAILSVETYGNQNLTGFVNLRVWYIKKKG